VSCEPAGAVGVLHDYQRRRFLTLIDPCRIRSRGLPHHPVTIAVGSGGIHRQGLAGGHPDAPRVHSERATDVPFSRVYSEQFGLIGARSLLVLYLALIHARAS